MVKNNQKNIIKISKSQFRGDEISFLFFAVLIFIFLVISLLRLSVVGKALDDFIFSFLFGWMKYVVYLITFSLIVPLWFNYRIKTKPKYVFIALLLLIICCWTIQTLSLLILNKDHLWTNYDNLNLPHITYNYFKAWWSANVVNNYHGFFASPISFTNGSIETFFPEYATGGMISNVLTGIFSYGFFATNFIANLMIIFFLSCSLIFNQPFILFAKMKKLIIFIKQKNDKRIANHDLKKKQRLVIKKEKLLMEKQALNKAKKELVVNQQDLPPLPTIKQIIKKETNNSDNVDKPLKQPATYFNENSYLTPFGKLDPKDQKDLVSNSKGTLVVKKSLEDSILNNDTNTTSVNNKTQENSKKSVNNRLTTFNFIPEQISINSAYVLPTLKEDVVKSSTSKNQQENEEQAISNQEKLTSLFQQFNINGSINGFHIGSAITKYEVSLIPGVKVNKITSLENDIKLILANNNIRIEAPIPGKSMIGIEVPNKHIITVSLQEVMKNIKTEDDKKKLLFVIGKDSIGKYMFQSLAQMPHLLIAGTTGSGKSVFINTLLISLLLQYKPHEIKFVLIDPKWVELVSYNTIPHLLVPVINDVNQAVCSLKVVLLEMERRYKLLASNSSRNIDSYNSKITDKAQKLPYYVVVIDELADLMVKNSKDIEEGIMRITQMGRAAGIHLVVATQRPSTDIITGVIKNNIAARVSFKVSSWIDSRTVIDSAGAEKLIGKGDMLFIGPGVSSPIRIQAPWISEEEVTEVLEFIKKQGNTKYDNNFIEAMENMK